MRVGIEWGSSSGVARIDRALDHLILNKAIVLFRLEALVFGIRRNGLMVALSAETVFCGIDDNQYRKIFGTQETQTNFFHIYYSITDI